MAASAGWGRPFTLAPPASLDVIPPQIAFSPFGAAAVGYGIQDEDVPANSTAFAAGRTARGKIDRPRKIGDAQQILSLAYRGQNLELLTGTSPKGLSCCSSVQARGSSKDGGFGPARTLISGLAGATIGRIVALPDGLLAVIATEHGVWVAQSAPSGRYGSVLRLTAPSALPEAMDASSLPNGQSAVAWTARPNRGAAGPTKIFVAKGSQKRPPRGAGTTITVPAGHRIDELALAASPSVPTVAWVESWFDAAGAFHSRVVAEDVRSKAKARPLSSPDELAAGLSFAADAKGEQALAWKACDSTGDCSVRAVVRPARGHFSPVAALPAVDASQTPAVTVSSRGVALIAWIQSGHVLAAQASPRSTRFGAAHVVSITNFAADLTLAFGPGRQALAAWTQGTLNQSVIGAVFSSG